MARRIAGLVTCGAVAGAATWALTRRWMSRPPEVPRRSTEPSPVIDEPASMAGEPAASWTRENFHGESVSLVGGPALAIGSAAGASVAPGLDARLRIAGAGTALAIGAVGLYDDLLGDSSSKGLLGHLEALRSGNVTTGAVKVGMIGLTGLAGASLVSRSAVDAVIGGAAIAGHANVINLLDLRPGRAGKVALLHAPLVLRGPGAGIGASALGAMLAAFPDDLGERAMLGDAGANALGGLLGLAMVAGEGRRARLAHLAVVTGLILASEKVSFSKVIESTPVLRDLDHLGRRL
ncbi:hypothetical protein EF847_13830 [Actinobacteria bacterium YIM 96077]|uniref:Glycosyl transferase family 4 n=1 Tax=Phytoactinopolyspora halophila TaxID=1981511 RepID=A0A329QJP8_9ACTN|nr:hypothetical protein [Phytoactinopolyspora halophila]AYY13616.1 hypothetical protein EF847_13830 [Actinobacteria bacterium YIM 96077]RAW10718.1 hypothetical protein DPM12_18490 [Phytoactinopolyspora halophila]